MENRNKGVLFLDEFLANNTEQITQNSIDENSFKELYEIEEYILRKQGNKVFISPERIYLDEQFPADFDNEVLEKSTINKNMSSVTSLKKRSKRNEKYRPKFVRGKGALREGLCEDCNLWFRLKTSSYWYHMNFKHGIAANGKKYPEPELFYKNGKALSVCKICNMDVSLGHNNKSMKYNWYKHFQKEHKNEYE